MSIDTMDLIRIGTSIAILRLKDEERKTLINFLKEIVKSADEADSIRILQVTSDTILFLKKIGVTNV